MAKTQGPDPIELFRSWFAEAEKKVIGDPTAVALATADKSGAPSLRMVLLKEADHRGFVFYTNVESRKGLELGANARAALCFYWQAIGRQIRIEGRVEPVSDDEADAYFATRDRGAQIGAWASVQSRPMQGRFELEKRVVKATTRFGLGKIPRPPFWTGYRVVPDAMEFWKQGTFRLHDRRRYTRNGTDWSVEHLYP